MARPGRILCHVSPAPNSLLRDGWLVQLCVARAHAVFPALGDSPVLSTAMTEAVSALAPLAFGAILDATNPARTTATEWGWPFVALGVGGLIATACAWRLPRDRA